MFSRARLAGRPVLGPSPRPPASADYSSGFGGKYGVQADRVDRSAVGFDYQGKTEKHESQKGLSVRGAAGTSPARVTRSQSELRARGATPRPIARGR